MTSMRTFVADVPPELLVQFFRRYEVELAEEAFSGRPVDVERAIEAALADGRRGGKSRLRTDMADINEMATAQGEVAISEAGSFVPQDLPSARARSLWLFLNNPADFEHAEDILYTNTRRGGREWSAFRGGKGASIVEDDEAMEAFREGLRKRFDCDNVHVDVFRRFGPARCDASDGPEGEDEPEAYQVMIYTEALPQAERAFEDGNLVTTSRRPVIEAALTFEPEAGIVECVAAGYNLREELAASFGANLLGGATEIEMKPMPVYSLEPLRTRLAFPVDPGDGIENVSLSCLRLVPVDSAEPRITMEKSGYRNVHDLWSDVEERLGRQALVSDYTIRHAKLLIQYRAKGRRPTRSLTVSLTPPNRCSLRDGSEIERRIAGKYLPRWGLVQR